MTAFADQLMIRYLDPLKVTALLTPQSDVNRQRMKALIAGVYEPKVLTVEAVDTVTVSTRHFQVAVVEPARVTGTLEKVIPSSERVLATFDLPALAHTNWIDMSLDTTVAVRVSTTSSALDAVTSEDVSQLSQQAFINKFAFLDLPGLMKVANVATYQELQADFPRLYNLHYATPPVYDPNDPAVQRTYRLRVSVLFFETLDVEGALRRMVETRRALDVIRRQVEEYEGGDILGSSAWIGVFPTGVFGPNVPITQNDLAALFAAERLVVAFETV